MGYRIYTKERDIIIVRTVKFIELSIKNPNNMTTVNTTLEENTIYPAKHSQKTEIYLETKICETQNQPSGVKLTTSEIGTEKNQ